MKLTNRQIAHILASLRVCQDKDIGNMPHFEETEPLTSEEVNELCELIS